MDCCQPITQREEMYSYLHGIWQGFSLVGEDLCLRVNRYMNWGVSLLLLPKLHSSHFMGSLISLEMLLLFIRHLIDEQGERRFGDGERSFDVVEVPAADDYTVSTVPESDDVGENKVGMDERSDDKYDKDSMCIYQDNKDSMCVCADKELSSKDDDDDSSEEDDDSKDTVSYSLMTAMTKTKRVRRMTAARTKTRLRLIRGYSYANK